MRRYLALAAVLTLAGCESDEDFWRPYDYVVGSRWPFVATGAPTAGSQIYDDAECVGVANQRADDAIANGYDADERETIFKGVYEECTEWNRTHPFK